MPLTVLQEPKTNPGSLTISFGNSFPEPPIVILTPFWNGSNSEVGSIPTISEITNDNCTIVSQNSASNYFLNVMVIERQTSEIGGIQAWVGQALKNGQSLELIFDSPVFKSLDPIVLLTSFWQGEHAIVGNIETLDDTARSEAKVVSNNQASNYFVNYLAMDRGFVPGLFEANTVNKTAQGTVRVYFANDFSDPPIVILSSWWNDANSQVGHIETVTKVTAQYFEFTSQNAASNYFVNWVAMTPGAVL